MNKKAILLAMFMLISLSSFAEEDLMNLLFMEGKTEAVIIKSNKLLKIEPYNPVNNFTLGAALQMNEQFSDSILYFKNAIKYSKNNTFITENSLNHLATSYYGIGNYNEAKSYFSKVLEKSKNNSILSYSLKYSKLFGLSDDYKNWNKVKSDHFIFHFQPKTKVENIKEFVADREKAFKKINSFFGVKNFPKKIDFFVWNSGEDSIKVINLNPGFSKPEYSLTHSYYNQSLGHEMTHIIANFSNRPKLKTPFITEGIAIYFDQFNQDNATLAKNRIIGAAKKHHIYKTTITELWKEDWKEWEKNHNNTKVPFYIISDSMSVGFIKVLIEKKGKEKLLELYKNQTYENAIKIYGEKDLISIINDYENYIYDKKNKK